MTYNVGNEKYKKVILENKKSFNDFIAGYPQYINIYDFEQGDKRFYGLKNKNNLEIIPKNDKILIDQAYNIVALDFVVYAYKEFANKYQDLLNTNQISTNSKINKAITAPVKSQIGFNMDDIFEQNKKSFSDLVIDNHLIALKTTKIEDFIECFSSNVLLLKNKFQTHLQYFKKNQPKNINGLTIDLFKIDFNNDQQKVDFFNDENFLIYRKLAEQYGFYINQDAPWQLVANLSNPNLHNILKQTYLKEGLIKQGIPVDVVVAMDGLNLLTLDANILLEKENFFAQLKAIGFEEQHLLTLKKYSLELKTKKITPNDIIKDYYDILLFIDYEKQKDFFYDAYIFLYDLRPTLIDSYFCAKSEETKIVKLKRQPPPLDKKSFYDLKENELLSLYSYLSILNSERNFKYTNFEIQNFKKQIKKKYYKSDGVDTKAALLYIYGKFEKLIP